MDTNIKGRVTETQQQTIEGMAFLFDLSPERVTEGLRKASPEQLRSVRNGSEAVALLLEVDPEIVSAEMRATTQATIARMAAHGVILPDTDFSELSGEVEVPQAA